MKKFVYNHYNALCYIIIIFATFLIFSNILFFFITGDECYQALSVRQYKDSPLAIGVFYIGHIFTNIFGDSIICLRIISKIAYILTICISCIYLYKRTNNLIISTLTFLICSTCSTIGGFNIFNWDTIAYPFEAVGLLFIIRYISTPSRSNIFWCGMMCGIMTIIRSPLLASTIICLITIILCNKGNYSKIINHCIVGLSICIITIIACSIIISGSIVNYIDSFSEDNIINGHGINNLKNIIWKFNHLIPYIIISGFGVTFSFILAWIEPYCKFHKKFFYAASIVCILTTYWLIVRLGAIHYGYDIIIFGMPYPFAFISLTFIPAYNFFINRKKMPSELKISLLATLMFYLLEGFGSDTPYERLNISYIFPITLGIIWTSLRHRHRSIFKTWIIFSSLTLPLICMFKVGFTFKYYTFPNLPPKHFEYLMFPKEEIELWQNLDSCVTMVKQFDKNLTKTVFWGLENYTPTYSYKEDPVISIQTFHMQDGDIDFLKEFDSRPLFIFLMHTAPEVKYNKTKENLICKHNYISLKVYPQFSLLMQKKDN